MQQKRGKNIAHHIVVFHAQSQHRSHLGHLSGLLQEAFHLLLTMCNVHCGTTDERVLQRGEAKGHKRGKDATKKFEKLHASFKTLIISVLHQYHHWEKGLETGIRERERSGLQYLGQKALRALESEFRILSFKKQQI